MYRNNNLLWFPDGFHSTECSCNWVWLRCTILHIFAYVGMNELFFIQSLLMTLSHSVHLNFVFILHSYISRQPPSNTIYVKIMLKERISLESPHLHSINYRIETKILYCTFTFTVKFEAHWWRPITWTKCNQLHISIIYICINYK